MGPYFERIRVDSYQRQGLFADFSCMCSQRTDHQTALADGWVMIPGRERLRRYLRLGLGLNLLFFLVYGGLNLLASLRSQRFHLYLDWELRIPFWPEMMLGYASLLVLFLLPPFALSPATLTGLAHRFVNATLIAAFIRSISSSAGMPCNPRVWPWLMYRLQKSSTASAVPRPLDVHWTPNCTSIPESLALNSPKRWNRWKSIILAEPVQSYFGGLRKHPNLQAANTFERYQLFGRYNVRYARCAMRDLYHFHVSSKPSKRLHFGS